MESAVSFAPLRPAGFVNVTGRGKTFWAVQEMLAQLKRNFLVDGYQQQTKLF